MIGAGGGSWRYGSKKNLRSTNRDFALYGYSTFFGTIGFRCAYSP